MKAASVKPAAKAAPCFDNEWHDAITRVALLKGLADAKMADDPKADVWSGVSWVLEELSTNLEAIREASLDDDKRLYALEHPEEAREDAKRERRAAKAGARPVVRGARRAIRRALPQLSTVQLVRLAATAELLAFGEDRGLWSSSIDWAEQEAQPYQVATVGRTRRGPR